jgi:hypothetical protein
MNSSRSTIGYFESLKPTHAALYFFFFFDWFQQRFVTMATDHWLTAMGTFQFNPKKNHLQRSVIG